MLVTMSISYSFLLARDKVKKKDVIVKNIL